MKSKLKPLIVILALGAIALGSSGCVSRCTYNQKWEYKTISQGHSSAGLDEAGKEGWQLVSVTEKSSYYTFFFKRPLSEK